MAQSDKSSLAARPTRAFNATSALVWVGVLGTALTLLSGLEGLVALSNGVRSAVAWWRMLTHSIWSWLFGWIGITIPKTLFALFNFAIFGMALAGGVRFRAKHSAKSAAAYPSADVSVGPWRVTASFLAMVFLSLLSLVVLAVLQQRGQGLTIQTIVFIWIAWSLFVMMLCFLWTHRFSKHALQLFPLALVYSSIVFLAPFLKSLNAKSYLDMALVVSSLAAINLIFSIMLAIAPPVALRKRLSGAIILAALVVLPVLGPLGLAQIYAMQAHSFLAAGQRDEALAGYQKSLSIRELLARGDPGNSDLQTDLSLFYSNFGDAFAASSQRTDATAAYKKAVTIGEQLASSDPASVLFQRNLGVYRRQLGDALAGDGKISEALPNYREAAALGEKLAQGDPENADLQTDLGVYYSKLGDALAAGDQRADAVATYRNSVTIGEKLANADPANALHQRNLGIYHRQLGDALAGDRKISEALPNYREAADLGEKLVQRDSENAGLQTELGVYYSKLGDALAAGDQRADAVATYRNSVTIGEKLANADPANALHQRNLGIYHRQLGDALAGDRKISEALPNYREAADLGEKLAQHEPDNAILQTDLDLYYNKLAATLLANGETAEAVVLQRKSVSLRDRLARGDPASIDRQTQLVEGYMRLGFVSAADGKREDALDALKAALVVSEHVASETERVEAASIGGAGRATAEALNRVAWCSLFAGNFDRALAATDRALALAPGLLLVELNRVYALLLLGRLEQARALYVANEGKQVPEASNKLWRDVFAEGSELLQKVGRVHIPTSWWR